MAYPTTNLMLSPIPKGNTKPPKKGDGSDKGNGGDTNGDANGGDTNGGNDSTQPTTKGDNAEYGGGGADGGTTIEDFKDIAGGIVDEIVNGGDGGLLDKDDAIEEVVAEETSEALKDDVQVGEQAYYVGDSSKDKIKQVADGLRNDGTAMNADIIESSASISAPLRTGLQRIVRGLETCSMRHGTRTGRSLSERRYAQTWGAIKSGTKVKRAYKKKTDKLDVSIACSIVVDQSGSMCDKLVATQIGVLALANAISDVGGQVEVIGYDNGRHRTADRDLEISHRCGWNVRLDIYMNYGERFNAVKHRFGRLRADGGTPTADAIQYALEGISERQEAHRVIFVLTDGCPNYGHTPVIRRQLRMAREAGIHIVGVGLGRGTKDVVNNYDDSVYAPNLSELSPLLLEKLEKIFDPSESKRGVKVAF